MTGTSAGGLVAALLCTRTDEELKELLVPELAQRITACEDAFGVWFKRWRETGARFSSIEWAKKVCMLQALSRVLADNLGHVLHIRVLDIQRSISTDWKGLERLGRPVRQTFVSLAVLEVVRNLADDIVLRFC